MVKITPIPDEDEDVVITPIPEEDVFITSHIVPPSSQPLPKFRLTLAETQKMNDVFKFPADQTVSVRARIHGDPDGRIFRLNCRLAKDTTLDRTNRVRLHISGQQFTNVFMFNDLNVYRYVEFYRSRNGLLVIRAVNPAPTHALDYPAPAAGPNQVEDQGDTIGCKESGGSGQTDTFGSAAFSLFNRVGGVDFSGVSVYDGVGWIGCAQVCLFHGPGRHAPWIAAAVPEVAAAKSRQINVVEPSSIPTVRTARSIYTSSRDSVSSHLPFSKEKEDNFGISQRILKMLNEGIHTWAPKLSIKAVVAFSPNVAIVGDSLAKILEYCGVEVLRRNQGGDTRFQKVYERLGVHIEDKGEISYNPYIPSVLEEISNQGLIEESEGARVIRIPGFNIPLIVVKRDGGFSYASTDLAALWYRLNEEKADWVIYVTDVGQQEHFEMFFHAARQAGWLSGDEDAYPKATHVAFGLVLGEDGKRFRTRSSEVVRLVDLLDEAKNRSRTALIERGKDAEWSEKELEQTAEKVGYGAVKYAVLMKHHLTDFDQMLNDKGNTAVYLLYAYARSCSIIMKSGKDIEELKKGGELVLDHTDERALGICLLQFSEIVEKACKNLSPNVICDYLYEKLSKCLTSFHNNCKVNQDASRLLLCEASITVMRKCFELLGITPVDKI